MNAKTLKRFQADSVFRAGWIFGFEYEKRILEAFLGSNEEYIATQRENIMAERARIRRHKKRRRGKAK